MAGPASNILLMGAALLLLWAGVRFFPDFMGQQAAKADPTGLRRWEVSVNGLALFVIVFVNLNLGLANLIPVPPLDGSRFLHFIAGRRLDPFMEFVDRNPWVAAVLIFFAFKYIAPQALAPFWMALIPTLAFIVGPDYSVSLWEAYWAQ
jgi:Zn-dependent protease